MSYSQPVFQYVPSHSFFLPSPVAQYSWARSATPVALPEFRLTVFSYYFPLLTIRTRPPREPMRIIQAEVAEGKVYSVFAEMIMHYSSLFRITLSDGTTEAYDITVTLPRPAWTSVFGFVVDWMMNDRSLKSTEVDPPVREYFNDKLIYEDHFHPTVRECIGIWLLADYLGMPELQVSLCRNLLPLTLAGEWSSTNQEAPELRTT